MKRLILIVIVSFSAAMSSVVSAQVQRSAADYLKEIQRLSNTKRPEDTEKAYTLSKEYLAKFPSDNSENVKKLKDFMRRFRLNSFFVATGANKSNEAFAIGREILAEEPENIEVLFNLAYSGYNDVVSNKSTSFSEDSIGYARRTLQLFDKGVVASNYSPFKDKQDATAFMYYVVGNLSISKDIKAAASNIYRSTLYESAIRKSASPFSQIANYYEIVYTRLSTDLNARIKAQSISDADAKTQNEKIGKTLDLMLDAYARAFVRASQNDPEMSGIQTRLKQVYQFRRKTDAGLDEFVAAIDKTPMPDPAAFEP